jgi:hypothetical protein
LAQSFAERVRKDAGAEPEKQIERAYWIALSRPPTGEERKVSLDALLRLRTLQGEKAAAGTSTNVAAKPAADRSGSVLEATATPALEEFCHTLMNSAAFLYID